MRCACHVCDTYMVHSEGLALGCVCPNCGYRCRACLGTDTVVSRENLKALSGDAALMRELFSDFDEEDGDEMECSRRGMWPDRERGRGE